ncbi:MAG: nuclear transport factor 2 family protein [Myxococcales bacterium]
MQTPRPEQRLATDWVAGFERRDVELLMSVFAEGATFWDPRFPPFAGLARIRAYYTEMMEKTRHWKVVCSAPYLLDSSAFALHTRSTFEMTSNGTVIDFPLVAFFRHHAGLITAYEEYWDTAYLMRQMAIGASQPESPPPV